MWQPIETAPRNTVIVAVISDIWQHGIPFRPAVVYIDDNDLVWDLLFDDEDQDRGDENPIPLSEWHLTHWCEHPAGTFPAADYKEVVLSTRFQND